LLVAFGYALDEKKVERSFGTTRKYFITSIRLCNTVFTISVPVKPNLHELSQFHWKLNCLQVCVFCI
jgi:hypothetical protein